jgi:hypothetical protein
MLYDEKAASPHDGGSNPLVRDVQKPQNIGKQARKRIGTHLRLMYDSLAQQPVPSRFTDLIAQLDDNTVDKA